MKSLAVLALMLLTACGGQATAGSPPSPTLPSTEPPAATHTTVAIETPASPTETGEAEPTSPFPSPTDVPPQPPGGRLLFSALASVEVRDADPQSAGRLDISPDGQLLAFDDQGLHVVSSNGGAPVRLTEVWAISDWAWSPDSKYIAFVSTVSGTISLVNVSGEGGVTVYDGDYGPYEVIGWLP